MFTRPDSRRGGNTGIDIELALLVVIPALALFTSSGIERALSTQQQTAVLPAKAYQNAATNTTVSQGIAVTNNSPFEQE